ncbi:MAG: amidohydrolase family protein, partial [Nitriliruptorales bacterium]|nr:amidohydrolase family protein [Nitriliruptorales bacterium]
RGADSQETWGPQAAASAPPLRTILDAGIPLGAGTDATVVSSFNPWLCVWWMVTGETVDGSPPRVEEQRLDLDEALRLYTSGSAWFSFEEDDRGNLGPGSLADITVLATDPFAVSPLGLRDVTADLTLVGGAVVHDSMGDQSPR